MRVVQATSSVITLRFFPWLLWCFGGLFTATGVVIAIVLSQSTTLICEKVSTAIGQCQLERTQFLYSEKVDIPLNQFLGVEARSVHPDTSDRYIYVLTTEGNFLFSTNYALDYQSSYRLVQDTVSFLSNPNQTELEISQDHRWFAYWFAGIFISVGAAIPILFAEVITCRFDRALNRFFLDCKGILKTKAFQYDLNDVKDVLVEESCGTYGSTYRLSIKIQPLSIQPEANNLKTLIIPLESYYSSGLTKRQAIADKIRYFLQQ